MIKTKINAIPVTTMQCSTVHFKADASFLTAVCLLLASLAACSSFRIMHSTMRIIGRMHENNREPFEKNNLRRIMGKNKSIIGHALFSLIISTMTPLNMAILNNLSASKSLYLKR